MAEESFITLGWQGVLIDVPSSWSVVGFYGNSIKGYFRIDSPIESAIEVKWSPAGKKSINLDKTAHNFIDGVKKQYLKHNKKLIFEREVKLGKDETSIDFSWRAGDRHGRGNIYICKECQRVVLSHLYFSRSDCKAQVINRIFSSIRDHEDSENLRFSLYGLDFSIPKDFKYTKPILMSAYLSLGFKRKFEKVVVEQRNLAGSLLKDASLEDWYNMDIAPDIKAYSLKYESISIKGMDAIKIFAKPSGFRGLLQSVFNFWNTPLNLKGYAWYDRDRNCIFTIRYLYNKDNNVLDILYKSMLEAKS